MNQKKRILPLILVFVMSILMSGCTTSNSKTDESAVSKTAYPLKVTDSYNREVTIDKEPERIISVAPNITETIYALGKGDKLVGRTDYCDYPSEASNVESIGTLTNPNIEKIVELKPDVVIVSTHFKKDNIDKLESLGIKIVSIYGEESFDGVYDTINKAAEILNVKQTGDKLVSDMKNKVETVTAKVKNLEKPSVYYVVGYGKYGDFTATKETFISEAIEMAGGNNAANDAEGWKYSLEKLVEKNPEILICDNKNNTKSSIEATDGYKDLKAVKEGKLLEIDSNLLNRQGPRLADGLEALAKLIHPEAFK